MIIKIYFYRVDMNKLKISSICFYPRGDLEGFTDIMSVIRWDYSLFSGDTLLIKQIEKIFNFKVDPPKTKEDEITEFLKSKNGEWK